MITVVWRVCRTKIEISTSAQSDQPRPLPFGLLSRVHLIRALSEYLLSERLDMRINWVLFLGLPIVRIFKAASYVS